MPLEVLATNAYFRMTLEPELRLVRWMRSSLPFGAVEQFEDVARQTVLGLLTVDRASHALLVDLRESPMRNDKAFEEVAHRFRRDVHHGFWRSAVLVKSQAGKLQILRHEKESPLDGEAHATFLDEGRALEFLTKG